MIAGATMPVDAKEALTRKLGPLPAWGWGVAIGGAILVVKLVRGGGSSDAGSSPTVVGGGGVVGTGGDATPTDEYSGSESVIENLLSESQAQGDLISGLKDTVTTLTDFKALQQQLTTLLTTRGTLLSKINTIKTNINGDRDKLRACKTKACERKWRASIDDRQKNLSSVQSQLTATNDAITKLQKKINESGQSS